jgi:hypothetical protein
VLAVPVAAVLDSGMRKLVFVERGVGQYEAVEIAAGPRTGDFYPVVSGLREGDRVVVRGNFLLDSQLQIRGLPSLFYEGGPAGASGHQHAGAAQAPAEHAPLAQPGGHDQHGP